MNIFSAKPHQAAQVATVVMDCLWNLISIHRSSILILYKLFSLASLFETHILLLLLQHLEETLWLGFQDFFESPRCFFHCTHIETCVMFCWHPKQKDGQCQRLVDRLLYLLKKRWPPKNNIPKELCKFFAKQKKPLLQCTCVFFGPHQRRTLLQCILQFQHGWAKTQQKRPLSPMCCGKTPAKKRKTATTLEWSSRVTTTTVIC